MNALFDAFKSGSARIKEHGESPADVSEPAKDKLRSGVYSGWVEHIRYRPKEHRFQYQVFMMYLDLDELDEVFSLSRLWSKDKAWAPAFFKRSDYLGDASKPLKGEVIRRIKEETGETFSGSVRLLTNVRYFGYVINPISCYYCFDENENLRYLVAEVTNTPWDEKISYVLPCENGTNILSTEFNKALHVSPFNPMDMVYRWHSNAPQEYLYINLSAAEGGFATLDANLYLKREEVSAEILARKVIQYPLMTVKVVALIYWQALRLLMKKVPIHKHARPSK